MFRRLPTMIALAVLLSSCARDTASDVKPRTALPPTLAGVYFGELPCSNCATIEATLWLRPDGRFFFRQHLRDEAASSAPAHAATTTYGLGRWAWDEVAAEAVLRGAGPERRLVVRDEQHLQLRVPSPAPHVLARDPVAPPFADRVTLDGESAVTVNGATFTECLTGLVLPVADAGAYRELRRQHRRLNPPGKVALTTVEAHLVTIEKESTTTERLVVDRFIALKPGKGC
jgi:copper homeostasis protein (lipoprotein)